MEKYLLNSANQNYIIKEIRLNLHWCNIPGRIYFPIHDPKKLSTFPGIVLCHGNNSLGQDYELISSLAKDLSINGYYVITFDNLCYNNSWYPETNALINPEDLDLRWGVFSAVTFLYSLPEIDKQKIYTMGHSMGGALALSVGAVDLRVQGIVAVSPTKVSRHISTKEQLEQYRMEELMLNTTRAYISRNIVLPLRHVTNAENYIKELSGKPILMTCAAKEQVEFNYQEWVKKLSHKIGDNCEFYIVEDSEHYYGTNPDSPVHHYYQQLLEKILLWFNNH